MMPISWVTLLTFASASLLAFALATLVYDGFFRYRLAVRERVKELSDKSRDDRSVSLFKDIDKLHSRDESHSRSRKERLQQIIEQSGVECTISMLFGWSACAGLVAAGGGSLRTWWLGALLAPMGAILPFAYVLWRKRARQRKYCRQLPEAFAMISRAVRAGQTVPAALQIIADDFEPPISSEFALCYEQQNLGMSRESALRKLAVRSGIMELQIFVVALLVQAKSGGDLVALLDNLASMIRKRLKLTERVRALTGEGRMQALVLIILPIAALFGISLMAPEYAKSLFDRPWLLVGTVAAQLAGALWIRRIINFEY